MYPIIRPQIIENEMDLEYELLLTLGLKFRNDILYDEFEELILVNKKLVKKVLRDINGEYIDNVNKNIETPFDITHNSKLINVLLNIGINFFTEKTGNEVVSFYQINLPNFKTVSELRLENGRKITSNPYYNQLLSYIDLIFMINNEFFILDKVDMTLEDIRNGN